jgi:hypothetical protein
MPVVGVPVITWFIQRAYKFMKYQCGKRTVVFMKTEWNTWEGLSRVLIKMAVVVGGLRTLGQGLRKQAACDRSEWVTERTPLKGRCILSLVS